MAVDLSLVKKLREQTGIGMLECKKAIEESGNDYAKAEEILRKKGFEKAKSKSGRQTKEGVLDFNVDNKESKAIILEINCETDFVAKNEDFLNLSKYLLKQIEEKEPKDVADLMGQASCSDDKITVENVISEAIHKIGENIVVKRFDTYNTSKNSYIGSYLHSNKKIAVLVDLELSKEVEENEDLKNVAKDVAMQVCALNPLYLDEKDVDEKAIEKEKDIYREQMRNSGKPENIIENIIQGKMKKFYSENCLVAQKFFKNDKTTITQLVKELSDKLGVDVKIKKFIRWQVGEEV